MPAEQVLGERRATAVGHDLKRGAGLLGEDAAGDVGRAADPDRAHGGLAVLLLEPGDEPLEVIGRQRFPGDDPDRRVGDQRDRLEIVHHVVVELHDRRIEDVGLHVADAHRVAVGRGVRHAADADGAAGAADVLDDDGLAERALHPLRQ